MIRDALLWAFVIAAALGIGLSGCAHNDHAGDDYLILKRMPDQ